MLSVELWKDLFGFAIKDVYYTYYDGHGRWYITSTHAFSSKIRKDDRFWYSIELNYGRDINSHNLGLHDRTYDNYMNLILFKRDIVFPTYIFLFLFPPSEKIETIRNTEVKTIPFPYSRFLLIVDYEVLYNMYTKIFDYALRYIREWIKR